MKKIKEFISHILNGQLVSILFAITIAVFVVISSKSNIIKYDNFKTFFEKGVLDILVFITTVAALIITFIVKFLKDDVKNIFDKDTELTEARLRRRELARLNTIFSENERLDLNLQDIREFEIKIAKNLENKYDRQLESKAIQRSIATILSPIIMNNQKYINTIQKNSIINLIIGIIGTLIAVTILSLTVLSEKHYLNINDFLIQLLPRITFVAFIQIFAFFFLRLYKNNLEDGKYFQNELTNLNAKCAALRIAVLTNNLEKQSEILSNLTLTERNFKIQKEETIVNLEKAKIEKEYDIEIFNTLKDFLKIQKNN